MPEKTTTNKNESSRPTEQKRVDTASKRPHAPYQQEAAEEFYPKEVIEAEPKGEESVGEHHEQLAEIADEYDATSPKNHQANQARWEADNGKAPDLSNAGGKTDNRDGTLDGASTRATQEAGKTGKKRA